MRVYTIGHGDRQPNEMLDLLVRQGITHVVDVRHAAEATDSPAFAPDRIRVDLLSRGIKYASMSTTLGHAAAEGPASGTDIDAYEDLQSGMTQLVQILMSDPDRVVCILGRQKEPEKCHRCHVIGEALARLRIEVSHIDEGEPIPHRSLVAG